MANPNPNLLFTFEDLSVKDKATKLVTRYFMRAGAHVTGVPEISPKLLRSAGITYREMLLVFNDSQRVILRIKQSGDIFQVLLNGKVLPIKNQDNHLKAIAEIVAKMDAGRAKFQKAMSFIKIKPPAGIRTAAPKMVETLTQRRDALKTAIAEINTQIEKLQSGALDNAIFDFTGPKYDPKKDKWVTVNGSRLMIREGEVVGGAKGKLNGRGKDGKHHTITDARYAKGKKLVRPHSGGSQFMSNSGHLARAVSNDNYTRREDGYVMSHSQAKFFEKLVEHGAEANSMSRDVKIDGKKMSLAEAKKHLKSKGVKFDNVAAQRRKK
jgi:hypothetical protein